MSRRIQSGRHRQACLLPTKYYYVNTTTRGAQPTSTRVGNFAGSLESKWCLNPPALRGGPVDYGIYVYTLKGNGNASTNQNFAVARPACSLIFC